MAILDFRLRSAGRRMRPRGLAVAPPPKERLALVSSSDRLCGIAAYTAALRRQIDDMFEVTVLELDQYLLRQSHGRMRRLGDRHIRDICRELRRFDAVNLQLEYGTLGRGDKDICRRFGWIAAAAPRLSVTFHSLMPPRSLDLAGVGHALVKRQFRTIADIWLEYRRCRRLSLGIAGHLHRAQRRKQVAAIAHNRRDARELEYLYRVNNVFDHPLAFLSGAEAAALRARASRRRFPVLDPIDDNAKLIGVFGFLNEYKGFATVVRALHHLPPDYHLLIFGGTHPNEIAPAQPIHPYLAALLDAAHVDHSLYDRISGGAAADAPPLFISAKRSLDALAGPHPRDLSRRIHFMGALPDGDFLIGMAICDVVVFPYLEVGQSASGPISQALELGCRVIASRTHAFLELGRYHKEAFELFDIGNHLELAERVVARPQFSARTALAYDTDSNKAVYFRANSSFAGMVRGDRSGYPLRPEGADEQARS